MPASADALLSDNQELQEVHPVIFDRIDATSVRTAALNTKGAAGPSGLVPEEANGRRKQRL